jgi:hypothetical protein
MALEIVPTVSKMVVLDEADAIHGRASPIAFVEVGRIGDVVLSINVGNGEFAGDVDENDVQYHYCVRGTIRCQFKCGDQELPAMEVQSGEILTIPAGIALRGRCTDGAVVLVIERRKPWHA